ncbi:hypothetical protein ACFYPZ_28925 [Streptomyces sp. NPDC005506]|uniref:hypothetical protein n=1 Tax=Streptomyces sp. NPDC005506 TaxID=3364718 RepID=UPI00367569E4
MGAALLERLDLAAACSAAATSPPATTWKTQITAYTVRYNRTGRPYRWRYDADAEHARHLESHTQHRGHPDAFGQAV